MSSLPLVIGAAVAACSAAAVHRVLLWSPAAGKLCPGYLAMWYGLTRGWRAAVVLVMLLSGALCGLAWEASPLFALSAIIVVVTATAAARGVRAMTGKER